MLANAATYVNRKTIEALKLLENKQISQEEYQEILKEPLDKTMVPYVDGGDTMH